MVGSADGVTVANSAVSEGVKKLLKDGGLVRGKPAKITKEGFAFILQEVNAQVWTMLIYYLEAASNVRQIFSPAIHISGIISNPQ